LGAGEKLGLFTRKRELAAAPEPSHHPPGNETLHSPAFLNILQGPFSRRDLAKTG
jgi:hypothetical protein